MRFFVCSVAVDRLKFRSAVHARRLHRHEIQQLLSYSLCN